MQYYYQKRLLPGLVVKSKYRWGALQLLVAALVAVAILYLATRTRASMHVLQRDLSAFSGTEFAPLPPPPPPMPLQQLRQATTAYSIDRRVPPRDPPKTRPRRRKFTRRQKEILLRRYGGRCAMCRIELDEYNTDWDHRIGLFHAGGNEVLYRQLDDALSNGQPLCLRCHRIKTIEERKSRVYKANLHSQRQRRQRRQRRIYRR